MEARASSGEVVVDGCPIRWSATGAGDPEVLLVHGGSAHAGWWAPTLRAHPGGQRFITMDLSGHGESGHRERYPTITWADEVAAVLRDAASGPAAIVGHSMGGRVSAVTAARHPELVAALVIVDAAVPPPDHEPLPAVRPARVHPTRAAAEAAFRLLPEQPAPPAAVLEEIARGSVVERDGGWTWKFDPRIFADLLGPTVEQHVGDIRCPVVAIHGQRSAITDPSQVMVLERQLGRAVPLLTVPHAHHHVLLDAPEALAALLAWLPETRPVGR